MTAAARGLVPFAFAFALALVGGCATASPPAVVRPSTPPGWTTVASDEGTIRLDLPPWIVPFDTSAAVFANERPDGPADGFMQVMALAPGAALPEPSTAAEAQAWLEALLRSPIAGPATVRTVELPGGTTIRVDRVDGAGTLHAWRFAGYAYRTPAGLAALVIDGPVDAWEGREADLELIPQLIRFAPAAIAGPAPAPAPGAGPPIAIDASQPSRPAPPRP